MAVLKAGPEALVDLAAFLEPFGRLVRRSESRQSLERYTTGLLSDLGRKTASDIGRAVAATSSQRLQEFLTRTAERRDELPPAAVVDDRERPWSSASGSDTMRRTAERRDEAPAPSGGPGRPPRIPLRVWNMLTEEERQAILAGAWDSQWLWARPAALAAMLTDDRKGQE